MHRQGKKVGLLIVAPLTLLQFSACLGCVLGSFEEAPACDFGGLTLGGWDVNLRHDGSG